MREHILIVEDEAVIYEGMRRFLEKNNYSVDEYTTNVADAIAKINLKKPDLVLLDINLKGEHTGLDLGKILYEDYNIPFIYVTQYDDDETFFKGKNTHHKHYFVKTQPTLKEKELLRVIQTILFNSIHEEKMPIIKGFILGYVDYVKNTKELSNDILHQKSVELTSVSFFTTNSATKDKTKSNNKGKDYYIKLKDNYVRFVDSVDEKSSLYLPFSLKKVKSYLPHYFAQISDDMIVNLLPYELEGIINGSVIKVNKNIYIISDTYKKEVEEKINSLYITSKNIANSTR